MLHVDLHKEGEERQGLVVARHEIDYLRPLSLPRRPRAGRDVGD
ncbi:hypothetical protein [Nonomuraea dietziae]